MFATLTMIAFFCSCAVLFVADTLEIDKFFRHSVCSFSIEGLIFIITIALGVVYGLSVVLTLLDLIS